MAADALTAYQADTAGRDALLMCDTTKMTDALNRRAHDDTIGANAPTVTAARGHRIGVGDLILSRCNDPTIDVWQGENRRVAAAPVPNGNRWRIAAIDTAGNRIAAERLTGRDAASDYDLEL
jgi:hypothetical protein